MYLQHKRNAYAALFAELEKLRALRACAWNMLGRSLLAPR